MISNWSQSRQQYLMKILRGKGTRSMVLNFLPKISCYGREPSDLPLRCDRCNQKLSITPGLEYKKGGLIIARHNEFRDELCDIALKLSHLQGFVMNPKSTTVATQKLEQPVKRNVNKSQSEKRGDSSSEDYGNLVLTVSLMFVSLPVTQMRSRVYQRILRRS